MKLSEFIEITNTKLWLAHEGSDPEVNFRVCCEDKEFKVSSEEVAFIASEEQIEIIIDIEL